MLHVQQAARAHNDCAQVGGRAHTYHVTPYRPVTFPPTDSRKRTRDNVADSWPRLHANVAQQARDACRVRRKCACFGFVLPLWSLRSRARLVTTTRKLIQPSSSTKATMMALASRAAATRATPALA